MYSLRVYAYVCSCRCGRGRASVRVHAWAPPSPAHLRRCCRDAAAQLAQRISALAFRARRAPCGFAALRFSCYRPATRLPAPPASPHLRRCCRDAAAQLAQRTCAPAFRARRALRPRRTAVLMLPPLTARSQLRPQLRRRGDGTAQLVRHISALAFRARRAPCARAALRFSCYRPAARLPAPPDSPHLRRCCRDAAAQLRCAALQLRNRAAARSVGMPAVRGSAPRLPRVSLHVP